MGKLVVKLVKFDGSVGKGQFFGSPWEIGYEIGYIKWVESERCVGRVNFLVAHNNQNIGYEIG